MNKIIQKLGVGILTIVITAMSFAMPALAATQIAVSPTSTMGWGEPDTRAGGDVSFIADATAPSGGAALQLTTDATTTAKAQYMHAASADMLLSSITELSYYTKQVSASFGDGAPSYQLPVDLNGSAAGGFTTFVYEPYQNGDVQPGVWQLWDVDAGNFWSSRTFNESGCAVTAGGGGEPFYSLADVASMCPNAVVLGFGVNIGTNNPSYTVETDLVSFNETAYDFELISKEDCKKSKWKDLTDSSGNAFKNQGQCVSYFENQ